MPNSHEPKSLGVLLIGDSPTDAALLVDELRQGAGAVEHERVDSLDATRRALREHEWDVVLCDYRLPGFTAKDTLALVAQERPEVPVVIVSGAVGEETAVDMVRAGAADFVRKDGLKRLAPAVERATERARRTRRRPQQPRERAWRFLSRHGAALLAIASDPQIRVRDLAVAIGVTERAAYGILGDLVEAGYVTRTRVGRRNRYAVHVEEGAAEPGPGNDRDAALLQALIARGGERRP